MNSIMNSFVRWTADCSPGEATPACAEHDILIPPSPSARVSCSLFFFFFPFEALMFFGVGCGFLFHGTGLRDCQFGLVFVFFPTHVVFTVGFFHVGGVQGSLNVCVLLAPSNEIDPRVRPGR